GRVGTAPSAKRPPPLPTLRRTVRLGAQVRRGRAVAPAEGAVEVGKIAKTAVVGDCTDLLVGAPPVGEPRVSAGKTLGQHIVGEAHAFALEQPLDGTRRA